MHPDLIPPTGIRPSLPAPVQDHNGFLKAFLPAPVLVHRLQPLRLLLHVGVRNLCEEEAVVLSDENPYRSNASVEVAFAAAEPSGLSE